VPADKGFCKGTVSSEGVAAGVQGPNSARSIVRDLLRDGRIAEERVYLDTAALTAARAVAWPEPVIRLD
jgi:hypothetical protein